MPLFNYQARDQKGQFQDGQIEAINENSAVGVLQSRGYVVTKITDYRGVGAAKRNQRMHRRVSSQDKLFFIQQTATLLDAGIPLIRSLEIIADQVSSSTLRKLVTQMAEDIKAGQTFSRSLSKNGKYFPAYWEYVIEAGEVSGNITNVLVQIAKGLESQIRLQTKIVTAIVYPAVLLFVSFGAILFFVFNIIPTFERFYSGFGQKMPAFTVVVMDVAKFVRSNSLFILIGIVAFVILFVQLIRTKAGKTQIDRIVLTLPVFGAAAHNLSVTRLTMILGMLLKSGVNLLKTIEITANSCENIVYEKSMKVVGLEIEKGKTLYDAMSKDALFPSMLTQLILVGEESGRLSEMIDKAADYYEKRVDVFITRLSVLIEPVIIVAVGAIIGILVVAMYLPVFNMASLIRAK